MKSAKWLITIKNENEKVYSSYEIDKELAIKIDKEVYKQI